MKRNFKASSILMTATLILSCNNSAEKDNLKEGQDKPNVLIILSDDQGWGDITSHGNDSVSTPNLDKLGSESYRFQRFYVSPVCAPTRASLLTGRYHLRTGVHGVTHREEVMRDTEYTLAELFKNNDYSTACFGKWHNGAQFPNNPTGQGFEHFFGFCAGHLNNYFNAELEYKGEFVKTEGYITDVLTDSAINYISANKGKPFFAYIAYNTPHSPFQVPDKYFNKYKAKGFSDKQSCILGMVENIDDNVGRLIQSLEDNKLSKKTIVLFLTDNGPNSWRFNGYMKGMKAWVDEGGVRVPFFLKIPWKSNNEKDVNAISAHIDILPSLASLCKLKLPEGLYIDGVDFTEYLDHPELENPDRMIFTDRGVGGKYPYGLRSQDYLLSLGKDTALYNLKLDPSQITDISAANPVLKDSLISEYEKWYREVTKFGFEQIPVQIGYKNYPVTRLPAHEANLSDNLHFKEGHGWANDWITDFKSRKDTISWKINVIEKAQYNIKLLLDSPANNKGSVLCLEYDNLKISKPIDRSFVSVPVKSEDRVIRQEIEEREWDELVFQNVPLHNGDYFLRICLDKDLDKGIEIKGIEVSRRLDD